MNVKFYRKIFRAIGKTGTTQQDHNKNNSDKPKQKLATDLETNLKYIKQALGDCEDLITRVICLGQGKNRAAIVYIDGLGDDYYIADIIIRMLMESTPETVRGGSKSIEEVERHLLPAGELKRVYAFEEVLKGILTGVTVLFIDGQPSALLIGTPMVKGRAIEKPEIENAVRGPRASFTENVKTNATMIRRIIKDPGLRFKTESIGSYTDTKIAIAYIEGIAGEDLVKEVINRVRSIEIDGILESGYIEQLIEDAPKSIFPTVGNTERPDRVAAGLLEGKVVILTDGTPIALIVPFFFWDVLRTPEDYYSRPYAASILRLIRFAAVILTMFLPAIYVSMVAFQPETLPTVLLITIAAAREGIPFPTLVEMLLMGLVFESLREAGVRLPRAVGQAISIVGALVIGDIAVTAGLFSAPGVVVTALAGISSFAVPALTDAYIPIRLAAVLLSGFFGIYGLGLFMFVLLVHLCSLRSLGVPYLTPVSPAAYRSWKDVFIRAPLWMLDRRPPELSRSDKRRMSPDMQPQPPVEEQGKGGRR